MSVNLRRPHFWEYRGLSALLLWPLSRAYSWLMRARMAHGKNKKLPLPCLCVGNATVGGEGKTPVVMAIAQKALIQGIQVAVVLKPHQVSVKNTFQVDPLQHTVLQVGDEALMVARRGIPTYVCADRYEAAFYCAEKGANLIIFDDGFQDPKIQKSYRLLIISPAPGNGFVLPAGPWREDAMAALQRADAYIVSKDIDCSSLPEKPRHMLHRHIFFPKVIKNRPVIAFCGLGRPEQFKDSLLKAGVKLLDFIAFPDHHVYTDRDLKMLSSRALKESAQLVSTEKDLVKIPLNSSLQVQEIELRIDLDQLQSIIDMTIFG